MRSGIDTLLVPGRALLSRESVVDGLFPMQSAPDALLDAGRSVLWFLPIFAPFFTLLMAWQERKLGIGVNGHAAVRFVVRPVGMYRNGSCGEVGWLQSEKV